MHSGLCGSVQSELDAFFADLGNRADRVRVVSAQAFCQARYRLHHNLFQPLLRQLVVLIEAQCPSPRWHGLRIVAADASKVRLTLQKNNVRTLVEGVAFGLFLPGIELCLASELYSPTDGERQMLFEHLELLAQDDLLILDRGYPAAWLAAVLNWIAIATIWKNWWPNVPGSWPRPRKRRTPPTSPRAPSWPT